MLLGWAGACSWCRSAHLRSVNTSLMAEKDSSQSLYQWPVIISLDHASVDAPGGLKALASVLPPGTELWPVGGITPSSMAGWVAAGATGFGIGSQLYAPGADAEAVRAKALEYVGAWGRGSTKPLP